MSAKDSISSGSFESEIALIIKDDADHIRKELAGIKHLSEYDLEPKPRRIIYDTYYDTSDNSLRQRKISLRTRRQGRILLISTKSDVRKVVGNIIRRRELELPWAYDSVQRLARKLKLETPTISVSQFQNTPVSRTLATMGLKTIQERQTQRVVRDVVRRDRRTTSILAEMAIDKVTYAFENVNVTLSEVEVEAKSARSLAGVREIADVLVSKYHPVLRQWFHGKFVTGLAIRKLLETRRFQSYLVNGDLKSDAFELIDRIVRSRRF